MKEHPQCRTGCENDMGYGKTPPSQGNQTQDQADVLVYDVPTGTKVEQPRKQ